MTITEVREEHIRFEHRGYKRNGLGVLCPKICCRAWYTSRWVVTLPSGETSSPMTRRQAERLANELAREEKS
jgi:hypothetical protein